MEVEDKVLAEALAEDPFHKGLREHGEFTGFRQPAMTDDEIEESRAKLARLMMNKQVLLVTCYLGLLFLMAKVYA